MNNIKFNGTISTERKKEINDLVTLFPNLDLLIVFDDFGDLNISSNGQFIAIVPHECINSNIPIKELINESLINFNARIMNQMIKSNKLINYIENELV